MDMKPEYLAKEAERLINDPVLQRAIGDIAKEATLELVDVKPDDLIRIIQLQQTARLCTEIFEQLNRYIMELPVEETPSL